MKRLISVVALAAVGCSGHWSQQARMVAGVSVAVADIAARLPDACDRAIASCDGDAACVADAADRCRRAVRSAEAASASARALADVLRADVDAVGGHHGPSLGEAIKAVIGAWRAVVSAARAIGVDVPWWSP